MLRMRCARHRVACPLTITLQPRSFLQPHSQLLQADLHDGALFFIIPCHGSQHSREGAAASSAVTEGADSSCTHSLQDNEAKQLPHSWDTCCRHSWAILQQQSIAGTQPSLYRARSSILTRMLLMAGKLWSGPPGPKADTAATT